MNIIGLDTSKVSTSMVIDVDGEKHYFSYNTNKETYKWNELINDFVKIRTYQYDNKIKDYSDKEVNKLIQFSKISSNLINDVKNTINFDKETIINIEGYSYGKSNQIVDLVGVGSTIRVKLYETVPNAKFNIIAPKSLKTKTCELVYGSEMVEQGKRKIKIVKVINPNHDGVSGGNFDKFHMLMAVTDYNKNDKLSEFIINNFDEMNSMSNVPKPIEDLVDAFFLKEINHI